MTFKKFMQSILCFFGIHDLKEWEGFKVQTYEDNAAVGLPYLSQGRRCSTCSKIKLAKIK